MFSTYRSPRWPWNRKKKKKKKTNIPLEQQPWYHGLLPRDDMTAILRKPGDFVVRLTQQQAGESMRIVISVVRSDERLSHILIKQDARMDNRYYVQENGKRFLTVAGLINNSLKEKLPLGEGVRLLNPVPRQNWELSHDQVQLQEKLGEGEFGEVFRGILTLDKRIPGIAVAVKTCRAKDLTKDQRLAFMKEARLMRQFKHPNIVTLFGIAANQEPLMIIMELVPGGSLKAFLENHPSVPTPEKIRFCYETALGMGYLECQTCIHRDLAARNCLLDERNRVKISDFGLSKSDDFYQMTAKRKVPVKWLSPESLSNGVYTLETDRWTFGILMWEVFSNGTDPYPGMGNVEVRKRVVEGYRMDAPPGTPENMQRIMQSCWNKDPKQRPDFRTIVSEFEQGRPTTHLSLNFN